MHKVYLLIGSNRGEKKTLIEKAQQRLDMLSVKSVLSSCYYESEPWGFESDEWFFNKAVLIETELSPESLLHEILDMEKDLGRIRGTQKVGYESREIDIDILLYDNLIIESKYLTIPHPRMHLRRFVLEPLMEINPDIIHPVLFKSVRDLYLNCPDKSVVIKSEL